MRELDKNCYRIAVIGSDDSTLSESERMHLFPICNEVGSKLIENNCLLFSGGDGGIGQKVLESYSDAGGTAIVFLPGNNHSSNKQVSIIPICTGLGYGIREIIMLRSVEAVISLAGGAGTLAELANAYHLMLPIYTIKGCYGWSEKLAETYIDNKRKIKISAQNTVGELFIDMINKIKYNRKLNIIKQNLI